jgi:hypothetical protein
MKKLLIDFLCWFIPSRNLRHKLRGCPLPSLETLTQILLETKEAIDGRINALDAKIDGRINVLDAKLDNKITELGAELCVAITESTELTHINIESSVLHQKTFGEYKNKFQGRSVVLVAAGPSVNDYIPIKDAIHVGCNRAFLFDKVKFDFLFAVDFRGIQDFLDDFIHYRDEDECIKFIGVSTIMDYQINESVIDKIKNVRRFKTDYLKYLHFYESLSITLDIDTSPLGHGYTITHEAMQFILFTNPAKIYLVGCDCNPDTATHFVEGPIDLWIKKEILNTPQAIYQRGKFIEGWGQMKKFAQTYYPETEIISVNPVGLKGMFKDIVQKENTA